MNTFGLGIIVGFILFAVIASVIIFNRMQLEIAKLARETENNNKALQMTFMKINKIERITQTTLEAAETFVDGLRESAEQIQRQIVRPPSPGKMNPEMFDDLRKSFEDGIRRFEDTDDDIEDIDEGDEDIDGENKEPWKK